MDNQTELYYLYGIFTNAIKTSTNLLYFENKNVYRLIEKYHDYSNSDYILITNFIKKLLAPVNEDIITENDFMIILQGYFDSLNVSNFQILHLSNKFKNLFNKLITIPFCENDHHIILQECNVYDLLDKVYKNPINMTQSLTYQNFINIIRKIDCKVRIVNENALIPSNIRLSDVGYDLTIISVYKQLNTTTTLYDTGIQIQVPFGYYIEIVPRSSLSKSGYILANSIGIIDNSYTGNLYVALAKIDKESPDIILPFKCCQLILRRQYFMNIIPQYDKLVETHRSGGCFGSTGQ